MTTSTTLRLPDDMAKSLDFIADYFERPKSRCMLSAIKQYIAEKMEEIEDAKEGEICLERLNDPDRITMSWDEAEKMAAEIRNV